MCVCVCVCVYACMYVYMHVCVCARVRVRASRHNYIIEPAATPFARCYKCSGPWWTIFPLSPPLPMLQSIAIFALELALRWNLSWNLKAMLQSTLRGICHTPASTPLCVYVCDANVAQFCTVACHSAFRSTSMAVAMAMDNL